MSSDPTQPVPEWWQQPQAPKKEQGAQKERDPQDSQATRQYPTSQGSPARPTFTPSQGNQSDQRYQPDQGYPSGPGFPSGPGYQQDQDYPGNQGSPGAPTYPANQGFPAGQDYQGAPARVRRRRRRWPWITLLVIVLVLVGGDFAAKAYAENRMARQVQSSLALSGKPNVTIQGFPFLTQAAARTFNTVDVNASNETAGPGGQLQIASLTATLHGMHIHGTNSATIDDFTASALVTFTALAHAGNIPGGITLSADGPNRVKAHVDLDVISGDVVLQVTQVGDSKINVKLVDANGLPTDLLGNLVNFTVTIPKLPAGVKIQKISITPQGLRLSASGHNTTLSQ